MLGAIHRDARIRVVNIDASLERTGFLTVLRRMGAEISTEHVGARVSFDAMSSSLQATEIYAHEIPSVDEVPVLSVAAAAASGVSAFRDMGELRLKESDRFEGSIALLREPGRRAWSDGNDFFVEGLSSATRFSPFVIDLTRHRMVMSAAVAGEGGDRVARCSVRRPFRRAYPRFFDDLNGLR